MTFTAIAKRAGQVFTASSEREAEILAKWFDGQGPHGVDGMCVPVPVEIVVRDTHPESEDWGTVWPCHVAKDTGEVYFINPISEPPYWWGTSRYIPLAANDSGSYSREGKLFQR